MCFVSAAQYKYVILAPIKQDWGKTYLCIFQVLVL